MPDMPVSTPLRNAMLLGVRDYFLDADVANGRMDVYDGAPPGTPGGPLDISNVKLSTIILDRPSGAIVSDGLALIASTLGLVLIDGTARWVRVTDGAGGWGFDRECGTVGSGKPVELDTVNLIAGGKVALISGKLR